MTATVTHSRAPSIGHVLQAKLEKYQPPRRRRPKGKKPKSRSQPAGRPQGRPAGDEAGAWPAANPDWPPGAAARGPAARGQGCVLLAEDGLRSSEAHLRTLRQRLEQSERTIVRVAWPAVRVAEAIRESESLRAMR